MHEISNFACKGDECMKEKHNANQTKNTEKIANKRVSPTASDVARLAGLSQSTVSRVFNPNWNGPMKESSRKKVLEVSKQIGYMPNAIAQILNSNHSNIIAVVISRQYDPFYSEVLTILTNLLEDRGLRTMVFTCSPTQNINQLLERVMQYKVDGVIITASAINYRMEETHVSRDIPVVLYNGYLPGMHISAVHSDNYSGCILAADYMASLGHKKYSYFATQSSIYSNYAPRQEAYLLGLHHQGIHDCYIQDSDYEYKAALAAAKTYFEQDNPPDCIFCSGDLNAIAVIDVARSKGYRVGEDVSIMGFYAQGVDFQAYQLTCLKQDIIQLARDAVDILQESIEHPGKSPVVMARQMELCIGKSTRPCPPDKFPFLQQLDK